jgi:hypothetical protein
VTVARRPATSTKRGAPNFALTSETTVRSLNVWPPLALGAAFYYKPPLRAR